MRSHLASCIGLHVNARYILLHTYQRDDDDDDESSSRTIFMIRKPMMPIFVDYGADFDDFHDKEGSNNQCYTHPILLLGSDCPYNTKCLEQCYVIFHQK